MIRGGVPSVLLNAQQQLTGTMTAGFPDRLDSDWTNSIIIFSEDPISLLPSQYDVGGLMKDNEHTCDGGYAMVATLYLNTGGDHRIPPITSVYNGFAVRRHYYGVLWS